MAHDAKFERVQLLRFVAAAAVAVTHASATAIQHFGGTAEQAAQSVFQWGALGVDLFFVISGFIIRYTIAVADPDWWTFLRRRLGRIVPLYWLCLIAMFVFGGLLGIGADQRPLGELVLDLLRSFAFLGWSEGDRRPLLLVGWTLEYEMYFYGLATLCIALSRRPALFLLGALGILVAVGQAVGLAKDERVIAFLCSPALLEFMCGILVANILVGDRPWLSGAITAAAAAALLAGGGVRVPVVAACAVAVVGIAVWRDRTWPVASGLRPFVRLGDASYSIYLTHFFTLAASNRALARLVPGLPVPAVMAVGVLASILVGFAVYRFVEQPMLRRVRHWGAPARASS